MTWSPTPGNYAFDASQYSAANAGQAAGVGCSGVSNKVAASAGGSPNIMRGGWRKGRRHYGGGLAYDVTTQPVSALTGPYAGTGIIDRLPGTADVPRTLNAFPKQFTGGRGRSRRRRFTQHGCRRIRSGRIRKSSGRIRKSSGRIRKSSGRKRKSSGRKSSGCKSSRRGGAYTKKKNNRNKKTQRRTLRGGSLISGSQYYTFNPTAVASNANSTPLSALANPMPSAGVDSCMAFKR